MHAYNKTFCKSWQARGFETFVCLYGMLQFISFWYQYSTWPGLWLNSRMRWVLQTASPLWHILQIFPTQVLWILIDRLSKFESSAKCKSVKKQWFMNFIFITAREKPKKTESSVLSVFIFRFSVFFGFLKTDVGIGFGFSKYRDIGSVFGIPTHDYTGPSCGQSDQSCKFRPSLKIFRHAYFCIGQW